MVFHAFQISLSVAEKLVFRTKKGPLSLIVLAQACAMCHVNNNILLTFNCESNWFKLAQCGYGGICIWMW